MKTSHPQLAVRLSLLLVAATLLLSSCSRRSVREVLGFNIARTVTHMAAGQTARLTAYEEYRETAGSLLSVQAAPLGSRLRARVAPSWSVSDSNLANINTEGILTALKPGRVRVKGAWGSFDATTEIEVVKGMPHKSLPQITAPAGARCSPQTADLSLDEERRLRFRMSGDGCTDMEVEAKAPETTLPWRFEAGARGELEITSARGPIVNGLVRMAGEEFSFTTWSAGAGAYPLSLKGKRVLLVGDSMAQGIGPFLQRKVEEAGGHWTSAAEQSSTIIWWQGSGKLRTLIANHGPDIIFIALGSNELFVRDADARASVIRRMVEEIGGRDAYWIGPPISKPGSNLVPIIEENFQEGRFYNSDTLDVPRGPDGKHPTTQGYERWVELVWTWYARAL